MPSISVDLYDDSKMVVVSSITVICSESEAKYLESLQKRKHFSAHLLAAGFGRNMTFKQFRQHFEQEHSSGSNDFWGTKND